MSRQLTEHIDGLLSPLDDSAPPAAGPGRQGGTRAPDGGSRPRRTVPEEPGTAGDAAPLRDTLEQQNELLRAILASLVDTQEDARSTAQNSRTFAWAGTAIALLTLVATVIAIVAAVALGDFVSRVTSRSADEFRMVRASAAVVQPSRWEGPTVSTMTCVRANGVDLGVEAFGRDDDPLVLLAGGPTMLSWPDSVCGRLAAGGRRVVRYDLRDCGASTTVDPQAPGYRLRDLAADAPALVRKLGAVTAHLGGVGVGGMVAQVAALDHPDAFSALTLVSTRPVAPGPVDDDLPDHDAATMGAVFSRPMPDWTDRSAVAAFAADGARLLGNDPEQAHATAARIWDRASSSDPSVQQANQLGIVFARLDCTPRWRERLGELTLPTLVVHGRADPFFPVGNGEALAGAIPDARLLVLDDMGTALRDAAADEVAAAMLAL